MLTTIRILMPPITATFGAPADVNAAQFGAIVYAIGAPPPPPPPVEGIPFSPPYDPVQTITGLLIR